MKTYLGLGSNIGDRLGYLQSAINALAEIGEVTAVSPVYETEPWGKTDQSKFLNAAVEMQTEYDPGTLLYKVKQIESELGRVERERWGPREIDIDILLFADKIIETEKLTVPHPYLHERAFVLVPLSDIADDIVHPTKNQTIKELKDGVDASSVGLVSESIHIN